MKSPKRRSCYVTFDGVSGVGKGTLIAWCKRYLEGRGEKIVLLEDNKTDPLRNYGAIMADWCKKNEVDHQTFLLPFFAAWAKFTEERLSELLSERGFVLRDRSFISALAYQSSSGIINPNKIWDLYVNYLRVRLPNLAVIVDVETEIAVSRVAQRKKRDIGLDGKMSNDKKRHQVIRERFLALPELFSADIDILVVSNNGEWTDNSELLEERLQKSGAEIISRLIEKGELL